MAAAPTKAKQARAIAALLDPTCKTNREAAERAGVSQRQLQTWLAEDADFQAALHTAEAELVAHATRRLLLLVDDAVDALSTALKEKPTYSLRAAALVLSHVLQWRDMADFEQRLASLEADA